MFVSNTRLLASASAAALAVVMFASTDSLARDSGRARNREVQEIAPMAREAEREIIFIMPPMKPVRNAAAPAKPAPSKLVEPANPAAPAKVAEPAKAPEPAKSAQPTKAAEASQPAAPDANAPPSNQAADGSARAAPAAPVSAPAQEMQAPAAVSADAPQPAVAASATPDQDISPLAPPQSAASAPTVVSTPPAGTAPVAEAPPVEQRLEAQKAPVAAAAQPVEAAPVASHQSPAPPTAQEPAASEPAPADPLEAAADASARIAALLNGGVKGPAEVRIADRATMWLPAGRVFVSGESAQKLAKEAGLELRAAALGLVAPAGEGLSWLAPIELLDDGFVKTGEADALQAEKLLAAFQAGLPEVNANRAKSGQPPVSLAGWLVPPALDDKHRLSACVNVVTEGGAQGGDRFFNCEAWALGRQGAIKVSVAEGGEQAERMKGEALALADTIVYDHGKAYEDVEVATDMPAPYAAADLLTSDVSAKNMAAALAAPADVQESGFSPVALLVKLWKVILFAAIAIGAVFAWFRRRNARGDAESLVASAGPAEDESQADADAAPAPSLFARLAPSLHARFAKPPAQSGNVAAAGRDAGVAAVSSRVVREDRAASQQPTSGGLMDRLSALRPGGAASTTESVDGADAIEGGPAAALKTLASRMRNAPEAPPAPVDVSRVIRAARALPGAAPPPPATEGPLLEDASLSVAAEAAPAARAPAAATPSNTGTAPVAEAEAFGGLVEPGDAAATSAAMHAREALRQASA